MISLSAIANFTNLAEGSLGILYTSATLHAALQLNELFLECKSVFLFSFVKKFSF